MVGKFVMSQAWCRPRRRLASATGGRLLSAPSTATPFCCYTPSPKRVAASLELYHGVRASPRGLKCGGTSPSRGSLGAVHVWSREETARLESARRCARRGGVILWRVSTVLLVVGVFFLLLIITLRVAVGSREAYNASKSCTIHAFDELMVYTKMVC